MSLNFSVERMKNYNVLTTLIEPAATDNGEANRKWHPVTEGLIFLTMGIGMNSITEKNWKDFYNRVNMWERTIGPQLWRGNVGPDDPKNYITPLEVFMHIGLGTNASSKTDNQFLKDCFINRNERNAKRCNEAEATYAKLSLDDISEADWQKAWSNPDSTITLNTDSLVTKMRVPDTPIGELGPTENVGS